MGVVEIMGKISIINIMVKLYLLFIYLFKEFNETFD